MGSASVAVETGSFDEDLRTVASPSRLCGRVCRTVKTEASKSAGSPWTRVLSAGTPPAEGPYHDNVARVDEFGHLGLMPNLSLSTRNRADLRSSQNQSAFAEDVDSSAGTLIVL
jgi:hypothetical protein